MGKQSPLKNNRNKRQPSKQPKPVKYQPPDNEEQRQKHIWTSIPGEYRRMPKK